MNSCKFKEPHKLVLMEQKQEAAIPVTVALQKVTPKAKVFGTGPTTIANTLIYIIRADIYGCPLFFYYSRGNIVD